MDGKQPRGPNTSGLAAMGIVLAAVVGWWVFSGQGPQGPSGNDARYAVPEVEATGSSTGASTAPEPAPGTVRIDGYVVVDELRLTLGYRIDPACAAALDTPRIIESDAAVTITLSTEPDAGSCNGTTELRSLDVLLDSPLDGRAVLDGSTSPQVRVAPTTTPYD